MTVNRFSQQSRAPDKSIVMRQVQEQARKTNRQVRVGLELVCKVGPSSAIARQIYSSKASSSSNQEAECVGQGLDQCGTWPGIGVVAVLLQHCSVGVQG